MIQLDDIINSGEFYLANYTDEYEDQSFSFQLKCSGMYKLDFSDVDELDELDDIEPDSNIWILELDIISLNKKKFDLDELKSQLKLVDEEGCEFDVVDDSHLCGYSDFAKKSGLCKFHYTELKPKITKKGALAFELPEYFESLSLAIEEGSIEPI